MADARQEALTALERIQSFDPETLIRDDEFGSTKNFAKAVAPARRLIELFGRITTRALEDLPDGQLNRIKDQANSTYQLFDQVMKFDTNKNTQERDALVQQIDGTYESTFNTLHPLISYSLYRSADFPRLESDARAALQSVSDHTAAVVSEMESVKADAVRVLDEVKKVAAETGVSQEASHFKTAADSHDAAARGWGIGTLAMAALTVAFAIGSMLLHKWPFLKPEGPYEVTQIVVSKILIFAVLSYVLILAARNFLSHKHNAIINRHRQRALQTYRTLVDAAKETANRDIVLTHAASCIFAPQPTGYSSGGSTSAPPGKSVVELVSVGAKAAS